MAASCFVNIEQSWSTADVAVCTGLAGAATLPMPAPREFPAVTITTTITVADERIVRCTFPPSDAIKVTILRVCLSSFIGAAARWA